MNTRTCSMRVKEYMEQYQMAETGDGILAAVSGGADSVCLLFVLKELSGPGGFHLAAFHLNHGIRGGEADRDETYVRTLCGNLGVPLKVVHEDVVGYAKEYGLSEEEAGRILRYRHLEAAAEEFSCNRIATAHHKDDNVETVLMNLFRGSGFKGLGGIRPVRGEVIRPLLCLTRREIEEYLNEKKIVWCEDSTNRELAYSRNRVRNILVPWVKENINDRAGEHILKTAEFAVQADEYFVSQAEKILWGNEPGTDGPHDVAENEKSVKIKTKVFDLQPDIMKSYIVRAMVSKAAGSGKDISARHIESVCALTGPGGGTKTDLPYGLFAVRGYDTLEIRRKETANVEGMPGITLKNKVFPWKKEMEIPKKQYTKWLDYDKIKDTLCVRTRKTGDFFEIGAGKQKLLNRFFIDEKIPKEERDKVLLLAEGSHIVWIIGYRISEFYKITDMTRTVLEVQVCKGENRG